MEQDRPLLVGFLLVPDFSLMGVTAGIDVLRHANRISGRRHFEWRVFTAENQPVTATNDLVLAPNSKLSDEIKLDILFVCSGSHPENHQNPRIFTWLRKRARHGSALGAITTGSYLLAKAGLLDGYACSTHWENSSSLALEFPQVEVRNSLYVIDRDRYTCSGATAALDMFLQIVADRLGPEKGPDLAIRIAEQLQVDRIRGGGDQQALLHRTSLGLKSRHMATAIAIMEETIEAPVPVSEIARRVGLTRRQLQRLFRQHTAKGPGEYGLQLRLERARLMVTQSSERILDIALQTGFGSHSHFSKCYRDHFGCSPKADRLSQVR